LLWYLGDGESLTLINAGMVVTTSVGGHDFTLNNPIYLGISQTVGSRTVTAIAASYQYNVPGPITIANGTTIPGAVDTLKTPLLTPADLLVSVDHGCAVHRHSTSFCKDRPLPRCAQRTMAVSGWIIPVIFSFRDCRCQVLALLPRISRSAENILVPARPLSDFTR